MNQELYGQSYKLPDNVLKAIKSAFVSNPSGDGVIRAKNLLRNRTITYQELKRLKNFFDNFNPETEGSIRYGLAGGDLMKNFVEQTLNTNRDAVQRSKDTRQDMNVDVNRGVKAYQGMPDLSLNEGKEELKKNALAVIVNNDDKILLLKRSDYEDQWMPNKWALVGGGVDKGERPAQACEREVKEETDLEIDDYTKSFTIQRNPDSIEYVFACRYKGDPTDVELDMKENVNYGWYDVAEMEYLDIVPNLIEYIMLVFKKYD